MMAWSAAIYSAETILIPWLEKKNLLKKQRDGAEKKAITLKKNFHFSLQKVTLHVGFVNFKLSYV